MDARVPRINQSSFDDLEY